MTSFSAGAERARPCGEGAPVLYQQGTAGRLVRGLLTCRPGQYFCAVGAKSVTDDPHPLKSLNSIRISYFGKMRRYAKNRSEENDGEPIKRELYLNRLIERKENGLVKIVAGIRRCGKSYLLFKLFYQYLLDSGVDAAGIIAVP